MSFNQVEDALIADAIEELGPQLRKFPEYKKLFRNGRPPYLGEGIHYMTVEDGKLTVGIETLPGSDIFHPNPQIEPVPCYDRMKPGEDIAAAVRRIFC